MATQASTGALKVALSESLSLSPIVNAQVSISFTGDPTSKTQNYVTDLSGQTKPISLEAPPKAYSETPNEPQPYANYTITVKAFGYEDTIVDGVEILPDRLALITITLKRTTPESSTLDTIVIPPHTLYGDYPPKIPEAEVKPVPDRGEVVLSRVVIPEYIIVHDGVPDDKEAKNYWVKYADYIKNVACSEIYSTWEDSTILANILCIMSFTLNRVYTEWYRSKGYDFTITSSTAYDQKWIYGRNIFSNVSKLVDQVFNNYVARPGIAQPIFTSYCDGDKVTCTGLSQWGSKYLGDEGYTPLEILRNYYGSDIYIATATQISGVPSSYPGFDLNIGSTGEKVRIAQQQLNRIADAYPAIPKLSVDGIYGPKTAQTVSIFQEVFDLPVTGVIDFATWYKISLIFVAVTRIAQPGS